MKLFIQDLVQGKRGYILISKESTRKLIRRAVAMWDISVIPQEVRSDLEDFGKLEWISDNSPSQLESIAHKINAQNRRVSGPKHQWDTKVPKMGLDSTSSHLGAN